MELRHYLTLLRRGWPAMVLCSLLGAGAAGFMTAAATPQYESSSTVYVSVGRADGAYEGYGDYGDGFYVIQRMNSFQDVARGDSFAHDVAETLGDGVDPRLLQGQVSVTAIQDSVLLSMSATTPDPETSAEISAAYAQEMVAVIEELEGSTPGRKGQFSATVTDDADVPVEAVSPQVMRNVASGVALGLFGGFLLVWFDFGSVVTRRSRESRFLRSPRVAFGAAARRRRRDEEG